MEKSFDLISIIIPIYNCEAYLEKTLQSVTNQTYKNLEIILLNDGSSDNSGQICDKYAKKDNRINVIHKENTGVSATRNLGLEKANGKYIYFMDSDDYIEPEMLEELVNIYEKYNVQLVNSGFFSEVHLIKNNEIVVNKDEICYLDKHFKTREEIASDFVMLWDTHMLYNIWNKLYLTEIIKGNNIIFPPYNFGEDVDFNREYLLKIDSLYNLKKCYYHYIRERQGALTSKFNPKLYDVRVKENKEFEDYFQRYGVQEEYYIEFTSRRHIERVLGCIENLYKKNCQLKFSEKYKEVKRIINDEPTRKGIKNMIPKSKKIKFLIIPIKLKLVLTTLLMGKTLSTIKDSFPALFNNMKNKR